MRVYHNPARKSRAVRRRRPKGRNIYGIARLLEKQPKALRSHEKWSQMAGYLKSDPELLNIRFNSRCYSLLHNGVIRPEHLENFYRTYRLPKNPFFPLFLLIKRDYLENRERRCREKKEYIREGLHRLPEYVRNVFIMAAGMEKDFNGGKLCPVYKKEFLPSTKKRMDEYLKYGHGDWIKFFESYLDKLGTAYESLPMKKVEYLDACLVLKMDPDEHYRRPREEDVNRRFRSLSKEFHPDRGGDPSLFIRLKWAGNYFRNNT